jgi:hypothetical protein
MDQLKRTIVQNTGASTVAAKQEFGTGVFSTTEQQYLGTLTHSSRNSLRQGMGSLDKQRQSLKAPSSYKHSDNGKLQGASLKTSYYVELVLTRG